MNLTLNNCVHTEKVATHALIELSQQKSEDKQINFDIELEKWMKMPPKAQISANKTENSPVKKPSRPSTALGPRPMSAKSDYHTHRPEIHGKEILLKKIFIQAPIIPVGFNFMQPPVIYKFKKRSNSLRTGNEGGHEIQNKALSIDANSRVTKKLRNSLCFKRKYRREKINCLGIRNFSKLL